MRVRIKNLWLPLIANGQNSGPSVCRARGNNSADPEALHVKT